jgi:hydroxypyruvate reductase
MTELTARELLTMLYETALDAVDGRHLVSKWCKENKKPFTHCIAIGKAAAAMLQGAHDELPSLKQSLLICPPSKITRQHKKLKNTLCIASSHPVPDESSLEAGDALLKFLGDTNDSDELLVLISGGTSSLVEVLNESITLNQLQQINQYLLASGKNIHQINAWRQQFSDIKGGGLLKYINSLAVTQLLLSDVKDDRAEFIGSGLLIASDAPVDADTYLSAFSTGQINTRTASGATVDTFIIGNIKLAMQSVNRAALSEGLDSYLYQEFIEGDVFYVAKNLYEKLKDARPGIHIWGGETTVLLPDNPGVGGRNLSLGLAFAQYLPDDSNIHLLAAGTDGVDGNSNCAGAVVSKFTIQKAKKMGLDIQQELDKANAGIVLMATDDLVQGENSNTNVMDIVIAYIID